ncbi:DUF6922 domain-containing protein [Formosa algae]|uniref:Uncharacterized protein YllA (UPF0747 family) n=1 Tax=Formosa algae TaxID=225843 RepID=A0A9X0YKB8_9FLAO|nr:hypothetical protein [Formosa algae]MBP1838769.1 uncharacterized protein YllA (UPF0747 family) [Formosa algae]MDQ0335269.1 uncharacterized protein YllA (UPF0747 family) [Formosa algae]OEI79849.1 hypothetical protein AST99_12370 [Formosa algae]
MKTEVNIANSAPKQVFWDMDVSQLSIKKDKALIIPRLLLATTKETFENDIKRVETTYSTHEIYTILKNTKERISNNVCRMVAERYNKPTFLRYKF